MDYTEGAHIVHFPTKHKFRVYVTLHAHIARQVSPAMAEDFHWVVSFIADSAEVNDEQDPVVSSSGSVNNFFAVPGLSSQVLCAHVPSSGFPDVPVFIASLTVHCFLCYWQVTGAATIYRPSRKGFRLYLRDPSATSGSHSSVPWTVNYLAFDGKSCENHCAQLGIPWVKNLLTHTCTLSLGAKFTLDCVVSGWSLYSTCSKSCGAGTQLRNRTVIQQPRSTGAPCPPIIHTHECNSNSCRECLYLRVRTILSLLFAHPAPRH